jgi:hypothetical protein
VGNLGWSSTRSMFLWWKIQDDCHHRIYFNIASYGKMNEKKIWNYNKIKSKVYMNVLLWKYFYLLASVFVVSTKRIDPWVLEFMVSNTLIIQSFLGLAI